MTISVTLLAFNWLWVHITQFCRASISWHVILAKGTFAFDHFVVWCGVVLCVECGVVAERIAPSIRSCIHRYRQIFICTKLLLSVSCLVYVVHVTVRLSVGGFYVDLSVFLCVCSVCSSLVILITVRVDKYVLHDNMRHCSSNYRFQFTLFSPSVFL